MAISTTSPANGQSNTYNYTGGMQSFTAPIDGIYKLECYGAQGGNGYTCSGGNGGYSVGYKQLTKGQIIYICVGGAGGSANSWDGTIAISNGGYNGGGKALGHNGAHGGSGGGATHMATKTGILSSLSGSKSNVLIVAGGGGGAYGPDNDTIKRVGGTGGGSTGGAGGAYTSESWRIAGKGGTQTAGGSGANGSQADSNTQINAVGASFGQGGYLSSYTNTTSGNAVLTGGGGGYYGGGAGFGGSAGGGSGYIGGVPSITFNGTTYSASTANGKRSGNGVAYITLAQILSIYNLRYNNNTPQKVFYNNVELNSLVYNNQLVFGLPLK